MPLDSYDSFSSRRGSGWIPSINRMLWCLIFVVACGTAGLSFIPELKRQREQNARKEQLRAEIEKEKALAAKQEREIELIQRDPRYIETIARDRLDLMKEGETIIRLEGVPGAAAQP